MTQTKNLTLHSYWRSSASYRVRMALNLKGLDYQIQPVHLVRDGGQQHGADYVALNPQELVPTLVHGQQVITQSMAMLEYLEEIHPEPALLPAEPPERARVRALAQAIACDIHPLNNLRVLKFLVDGMGHDEAGKMVWIRHWTESGLAAVEKMLADSDHTGRYCHGDFPTFADCCLLPQVYNALRFNCTMDGLEHIRRICSNLEQLPAITRAAPENQTDAE
jgi:maleylacetoacetate isomerase